MKKRKCMADGGMVLAADEKRETVEQMLARMNAKYGTGIPSPAPQPQAPAPQPQAPAQQQTGIVDSLRRRNEELKKAANYARGGVKRMEAGGIAGLPDNLIGGPRYDSPRGAFVWEDGTRRDGLTEQQGAQLDAEIAMNKARADAGIAQNAGASAAPVQTMAEQQVAAGINPNAPYRPGGIGDPHASALPFIPQPSIGRRAGRTMGYAAGGVKDFRIGDAAPVVGKGTGTSDEVPAVLAGDEVRLSNGEAVVVLPKKTANNEAAVEAIEGIIAATNGKPPVPRDADEMGCGGVKKRMERGGIVMGMAEKIKEMMSGAKQIATDKATEGIQSVRDWAKDTSGTSSLQEEAARRRNALRDATGYDEPVKRYAKGGVLPTRYVPDEIDLARGLMETERAREADARSRQEYANKLARDDAMAKTTAAGRNFPVAPESPPPSPQPPHPPAVRPYQPNWQHGDSSQPIEGVVETRADQMRASANAAPRQIQAPAPSTSLVPTRNVDWVFGDPRSRSVILRPYSPDFTLGETGPIQSPSMRSTQPQGIAQGLLPSPPAEFKPDVTDSTMRQTAAGRRASGGQSPEAARWKAEIESSNSFTKPERAGFMPNTNEVLKSGIAGKIPERYIPESPPVGGLRGAAVSTVNAIPKVARVLAPVAVGADALNRAKTVADVAQSGGNPYVAGAEQVSEMAGGLAGAGIGATGVLAAGAPLIAASGPFAPATAAGLGLIGGGIGYFGGQEAVKGITHAGRRVADFFTGNQTADKSYSTPEPDQPLPIQRTTRNLSVAQQPSPIDVARTDLQNTKAALAEAQNQLNQERLAQTTGNAGGARFNPQTGSLSFLAQKGYDPTTQVYAPGTGAITSPRTGQTMVVTPGRYIAADGTETSDWRKTQDYADAQQRNQNMLAELAQMKAERQGRDPVQSLSDLARIPMAQQAAKLESEKGALGNRLAGQQLSIGDINLRQQQALQALYAAHQAAKTPEQAAAIAEQIRVMTLKDRPSHWKPVITHGAKTLEGSEPDSGYLVHEQTGEVRPLKMGQENIPPIPKDKASLKVGQVYRMADGRIGTWIGNGFRPQ